MNPKKKVTRQQIDNIKKDYALGIPRTILKYVYGISMTKLNEIIKKDRRDL